MADALTPAPHSSPPPVRGRSLALSVLGAAVVGFILVAAFGRVTGFAEIGDALDGASWQWLTLCVVGQVAVFGGYAGVFRSATSFEGGPAVAPAHALKVVMASFGLTQLVATGGAAGLAFTYWALRQVGFDPRDAVVRLIGMNTAVYLVFASIAWSAAVVALPTPAAPAGMALPWIVGVPVVIALARWFTAPARVARFTDSGGGRLKELLGTGVAAAAWVRRALFAAEGRNLIGWAVLYWIGDIVSLWAALAAFGEPRAIHVVVLAYCTGYLAQLIPIPFLATGGVDAATTLTLTAVGVPVEVALLGVVAHRVFAFWLPIVPGLVFATSLARNRIGSPAMQGGSPPAAPRARERPAARYPLGRGPQSRRNTGRHDGPSTR